MYLNQIVTNSQMWILISIHTHHYWVQFSVQWICTTYLNMQHGCTFSTCPLFYFDPNVFNVCISILMIYVKGDSKVIKLNVERGCCSALRGCVSFCLNKNQNKFTILPCKISGQFVHWGLSYIHHHHYHL